MGAKLSENTVKNLPAPERGNRVTYFAGDIVQGAEAPPGFGVRTTANGAKSFVLNYRVGPVERRFTIGRSPAWSVVKAIKRARDLRQEIDKGRDPTAEKRAARIPAPEAPKVKTVADVLDDFAARHLRKNLRSGARVEKALNDLVKPAIGNTAILALRRSSVVEMLDRIEDDRGPVSADRALAYLRKALNWYATRDDDFNTPIVRGMARTNPKERARKRILADDEIRDVWAALDIMKGPAPFPRLVRALLLSCARRDEVAGMTWGELDDDVWVVPPERYKTGLEHAVPLTPELQGIIGRKPATAAGSFVFSTTGGTRPFSGYGKAKAALDEKIAEIRLAAGRRAMPPWVLHDLRRTGRTLLSRAGIDANVAERVLGHVIGGIRETYDRHTYLPQKKDALEKLTALVERILDPPAGNNVVALALHGAAA